MNPTQENSVYKNNASPDFEKGDVMKISPVKLVMQPNFQFNSTHNVDQKDSVYLSGTSAITRS